MKPSLQFHLEGAGKSEVHCSAAKSIDFNYVCVWATFSHLTLLAFHFLLLLLSVAQVAQQWFNRWWWEEWMNDARSGTRNFIIRAGLHMHIPFPVVNNTYIFTNYNYCKLLLWRFFPTCTCRVLPLIQSHFRVTYMCDVPATESEWAEKRLITFSISRFVSPVQILFPFVSAANWCLESKEGKEKDEKSKAKSNGVGCQKNGFDTVGWRWWWLWCVVAIEKSLFTHTKLDSFFSQWAKEAENAVGLPLRACHQQGKNCRPQTHSHIHSRRVHNS